MASFEYHIARRLFFQPQQDKQVSRPAVRIALIGIAVGLAVMISAVCIVIGFKHQVEANVMGLSSHIQVTNYHSNYSYEMVPIERPDTLPSVLQDIPNIRHIQRYTTKTGMLKTQDDVQAMIFKGLADDFDWSFLQEKIVSGEIPDYQGEKPSNGVLISQHTANLMRLAPGDSFYAYFTRDEQVLARKWQVAAVFDTHFSEFDQHFLLLDNRHLARLNGWEPHQAGGLEIFVEDIRDIVDTDVEVYNRLFSFGAEHELAYYTQSVYDLNPQIFGWLDLLDMNVWLILALMIFVSGFNMISGLLILILERTNLIGMLKAMGANNMSLRKIFLWLSLMLTARGMFWGNVLGLGLCALQYFFHIIPLDPAVYYVSSVPVEFNFLFIILLNLGVAIASFLMMLLPSGLVSRIVPVKSIRFD